MAPLDNLLWDRNLIRMIFDFDYKWEIYTPVEKRKYGHYVLPILYGDRLIGRIEAPYDRKEKQLNVKISGMSRESGRRQRCRGRLTVQWSGWLNLTGGKDAEVSGFTFPPP